MQERGISPLIATILLVGLTVSIITVIVAWSQDIFKSVSESSEESLTQFELEQKIRVTVESAIIRTTENQGIQALKSAQEETMPSSPQLPEEKTVSITLTNQAEIAIDAFRIIVYYKNKERDMINIQKTVEPWKSTELEVSIQEKGREREYIEIIPMINEREILTGSVKITPQEE